MTNHHDEDEREHMLLSGVDTTDKRFDPDPCGYYAALGISQNASQKDIRRAFLHLSRTYHTDKHSGESADTIQLMNERFQGLQDAYTVLSDPKQRVAYDVGGQLGISRLALIPQSINRREDIARYLELLEQEAEVLRLSKTLSTRSDVSIVYSLAHLFLPKKPHLAPVQPSANEDDAEPPSPVHETEEKNGDELHNTSNATTTAAAETGGAPLNAITAQFSAKEVVLDGHPQIILLPPPEFQRMLRGRMANAAASADRASRTESDERSVLGMVVSLRNALMRVQAESLYFAHSFHHVFSPDAVAEFTTRASHTKHGMLMGCKGVLRYTADEVTTYTTTYDLSKDGGDFYVSRERALSPVWTLTTGVHLFGRKGLLQRYRLGLQRKLSETWTLKNQLQMSLTEYGSFSTYIAGVTSTNVFNRIHLHSGNGNLHLGVSRELPIVFQDGEGETLKPAKGFIRPFVNLGISGNLDVGFDVWYERSKYHRIGIGFSSTLAVAGSVNSSTGRRVAGLGINEFCLLYAKGQHNIRIPFLVFYSLGAQYVALWVSAPLLLYRMAQLLWRPYRNRQVAAFYKQQRITHQAEMDVARVRAIREQRAIELSSMRIRMAEEGIGGLVIVNAKYGVLNPRYPEISQERKKNGATNNTSHIPWWKRWWVRRRSMKPNMVTMNTADIERGVDLRDEDEKDDEDTASPLVLDVTVAVQNFVQESHLTLPGGPKSRLAGFADPDPFTAEKKELKIVYRFHHKRHVVVVNDEDALQLPQREHLVDL